jgi:hypothetical protein
MQKTKVLPPPLPENYYSGMQKTKESSPPLPENYLTMKDDYYKFNQEQKRKEDEKRRREEDERIQEEEKRKQKKIEYIDKTVEHQRENGIYAGFQQVLSDNNLISKYEFYRFIEDMIANVDNENLLSGLPIYIRNNLTTVQRTMMLIAKGFNTFTKGFMKEVEKSWKDDKAYTNFWTRRPRNWERQVFGVIDTNESYYDIQLYNFMYNERCWRFDAAPFVESINTAYRFVCYYVIEYDKKKTICSRYDPSFGYFFKIFAFIYYKQHGFDPNLKLKMSYEQFLILNLDGSYKPLIPDDIKKNYEYYHLDDNIFRAEFVDYLESKFLEGKKEGLKKKVEDNMFISKEEFIEYLNDISIELKKRYYGLEIYKTNENSIIKKIEELISYIQTDKKEDLGKKIKEILDDIIDRKNILDSAMFSHVSERFLLYTNLYGIISIYARQQKIIEATLKEIYNSYHKSKKFNGETKTRATKTGGGRSKRQKRNYTKKRKTKRSRK